MATTGESRLDRLLADLQPTLHEQAYVFLTLPDAIPAAWSLKPLATFAEREGLSVILLQADADRLGQRYDSTWACITLAVHSSLTSVGLLAAVLPRLAAAGISVNPVAAFYHDHLFVPWERRVEALRLFKEKSS